MQVKVLVVDDDPVIQTLLREYLGSCGYQVEICTGGTSALEYLSSNKPDVIVLDMIMPDMTGLDVLRKVRSDLSTKDLRVILLSAEQGLTAGEGPVADGYLQKPFEMKKIKEVIDGLTAK